jgi:hypothetical protein
MFPEWTDAALERKWTDWDDRHGCNCGYTKCRFANARPEPVFRYFSKAIALVSLVNSITATKRHGRSVAVCRDPPVLCVSKRLATSEVSPE